MLAVRLDAMRRALLVLAALAPTAAEQPLRAQGFPPYPTVAPAIAPPAPGPYAGPALAAPPVPAAPAGPTGPVAPAAPLAARGMPTVHWRHPVFFIPYAANPLDADRVAQVVLFVSQNEGPWQRLETARPEVRGFAYHAPNEGSYQFALQFADRGGRVWPSGPPQAQLQVQIDLTPPTVRLTADRDASGAVLIQYEIYDAHLDPQGWRLEAQAGPQGLWEPLTATTPVTEQPDRRLGSCSWYGANGAADGTIRLTARDQAGNETVETTVVAARGPWQGASPANSAAPPPIAAWPASAASGPLFRPPGAAAGGAAAPFADPFAASAGSPGLPGPPAATPREPGAPAVDWPVSNAAPPPRAENALVGAPAAANDWQSAIRPRPAWDAEGAAAVAADAAPRSVPSPFSSVSVSSLGDDRAVPPPLLDPQRASTSAPADWPSTGPSPAASAPTSPPGAWTDRGPAAAGTLTAQDVRQVNSRTFELHYDLQAVGPWGVSHVELWATRDDGQTWTSYGVDADNRSPCQVTVAEPGDYGFVIVVSAAGSLGAPPPRPGDRPELKIHVDLRPPDCQLLPPQHGTGEHADHLLLRWQAVDSNLEPQPIGLYYSSSPQGPWSTIAAGLSNSGVYPWKIERHLPERFYLRLEVRDVAGNFSFDQTPSPVALDRPQPVGRLRDIRPVSP